MKWGNAESNLSERWEQLYKDVLCEQDEQMMPRRIERARHAILDRLEDVSCARKKQIPQAGELAALRNAHRALRVLDLLYLGDSDGDGGAGKLIA